MIFKNNTKNIKRELANIDSTLQTVEVKGDSVMILAFLRQKIKELYDTTTEEEEVGDKKEEV